MPCYRPLRGFYSPIVNQNGKRDIVFSRSEAIDKSGLSPISDREVEIPCRQCIHCRLSISAEKAQRCVHEASLYDANCFVTLTYNDAHLPKGYHLWRRNAETKKYGWTELHPAPGSVDPKDPTLFVMRLREKYGSGIRTFGCMEYGELLSRPHYHICIFNHDFKDKKIWKQSRENPLYRSDELESLWTLGNSTIGALTFETAAYTARYCTKKVTGKGASSHYESFDEKTGEVFQLLPEGPVCVSRNPGLGKGWYEKYGSFVRNHDHIVMRGTRLRPAKYYDRLFDLADPESFSKLKKSRKIGGRLAAEKLEDEDARGYANQVWEHGCATPKLRLHVMEEVHELKIKQLKRTFENG